MISWMFASCFLFLPRNLSEKNYTTSNYPLENIFQIHCTPKMNKKKDKWNWAQLESSSFVLLELVWIIEEFDISLTFTIISISPFQSHSQSIIIIQAYKVIFCLCRILQLRNLSQRSHRYCNEYCSVFIKFSHCCNDSNSDDDSNYAVIHFQFDDLNILRISNWMDFKCSNREMLGIKLVSSNNQLNLRKS